MASGFRNPAVTQAGRKVNPTEKVRILLQDQQETAIQQLLNRKKTVEDDLHAAMHREVAVGEVKLIFGEWSAICDELATCDVEFRQLAKGEELQKHIDYFNELTTRTQETAEKVATFLHQHPRETGPRAGVRRMLEEETRRLESQIHEIESRIEHSRLSSKALGTTSRAGILTLPDPTTSLSANTSKPVGVSTSQAPAGPSTSQTQTGASTSHIPVGASASTMPIGAPSTTFMPRKASTPRAPAPAAPVPASTDNTTAVLGKLVDLLDKRRDKLPTMEPDVFKGEVLMYPLWISAFETLIEKNTASNQEKLFYLGKYTSGEARECIAGFLTLYSEDAFYRAKGTLQDRYGDQVKIAAAYRKRLFAWAAIKKGDGPALQKFTDFLWQCQAAMESVGHLASLNTADDSARLLKIIPTYISEKWARIVDRWYYPDGEDGVPGEVGAYPPFYEFCRLLARESRIANGPMATPVAAQDAATSSKQKNPARRAQNFMSQTTTEAAKPRDDRPLRCHFCHQGHHINECETFLSKPSADKTEYAKVKGLCFGCLRRGHSYRICRSRNPALLKDSVAPTSHTSHRVQVAGNAEENEGYFSLILKMEITHPDAPDRGMLVYGLLDTQSDSTFVSSEVIEELGVQGSDVELELITMGAASNIRSTLIHNLQIRGANERSSTTIPSCFTRDHIPANRDHIPTREAVSRWEHLRLVAQQIPQYDPQVPVGILIGNNCPSVLLQRLIIEDGDDKPYGVYTKVGWGVMGRQHDARAAVARCFKTSTKIVTQHEMARAFDFEFGEPCDRAQKASQDDRLFLEKVRESIHRREDRHYELDLPFREEPAILPNNYHVAHRRLQSLGRKLRKNEEYRRQYTACMEELLTRDYARLVTTPAAPGQSNYLPHHAVTHPRKPGEIRGVWDGGAELDGKSLNKLLLTGPDLTNNLVGVLVRFREEPIAFMCDIKGMFLQVGVSEHHRDYLRFLWFKEGDPDAEVQEYQMQVHLFGAASSPGCVNFTVKQLADDYEKKYGRDVAEFIRRHFYVDDGLKSMRTVDETVSLFLRAHAMFQEGGFNLIKFTCNNAEVLSRIPEELLAKSVKPGEKPLMLLPVETSLGLRWDMEADAFVFVLVCLHYQATRRGLLSALSKIYDPIGFIAPIVLVGRLLLQKLCLAEARWDDELPESYMTHWRQWYDGLQQLSTLCIPRCLKGHDQTEVEVRLHHFSDASSVAYGACSYAQLISPDGRVSTRLVLAKARVAPKKAVTIPRLELQAAVVAVQLAETLNAELTYTDVTNFFWSDSRVVLGYIKNQSKRFHLYVRNRVQRVLEGSHADSWNHVSTDNNPADLASRGSGVTELRDRELWWSGPEFMQRPDVPASPEAFSVSDDDPEVKAEVVVHTTVVERHFLSRLFETTSSWRPLVMRIGWLTRAVRYLKARRDNKLTELKLPPALLVKELRQAEALVVRHVQMESFPDEYGQLQRNPGYPLERLDVRARNQRLRRSSNLFKLDVFVDELGVMRVGGRLRRSFLPLEMKHPAVLPSQHHITTLFVERAHELVNHMGRQSTLARLRELGVWVLHSRSAVDRVLRQCVTCAKLKRPPEVQKMADLPPERVSEDPPFTHCGVDVFGPVVVKEGRSLKKRWICLFTCMAIRAAHLEVLAAMTTASFINAFRRLVCRRGPVRTLRSDCGSNFVGAKNEQDAALAALDLPKVQAELLKHECDWVEYQFNPPKASHMGGVWERMGRTMKSTLLHLLAIHGEQLSEELLCTLVAETEATLNSRPIVCVDVSDPWSEPPLSPARLLTLKYRPAAAPVGVFVDQDVYATRAWRRAQVIADQFWRQWRTEFLPDLQTRRKWNNQQYNIRAGDIVTMVDDVTPRNQWPLARVMEALPSSDGLVRRVKLKVRDTQLERPISKVVYLCSPDDYPIEPEVLETYRRQDV